MVGGKIVNLVGDAVLGLFRVDGAPQRLAGRSLPPGKRRRRLEVIAAGADGLALDFGIALHLGQVIYGNVGVPERLRFTLVGRRSTKLSGCRILTSSDSATHCWRRLRSAVPGGPWRPLGEHCCAGSRRRRRSWLCCLTIVGQVARPSLSANARARFCVHDERARLNVRAPRVAVVCDPAATNA